MDSSLAHQPLPRPLLRGVLHQYACFAFAALGLALVAVAPANRERLASAVFAGSVVFTFGISALYHRVTWRPTARLMMRRLDHAGVFVLIGGTYTAFVLLALHGAWQVSILAVVWGGVGLAILVKLAWVDAPGWMSAAFGIALGWISVVALPQALDATGVWGIALLASGGIFYTLGAVVYARKRPDPIPAIFGYHELFHLLTIVAAACQFAAIAFFLVGAA